MGMFWQIKIETYSKDNELVGTCWLDRFSNAWDADTFIREFCKLCDMWKLIDDEGSIRARKDNKDGTWDYMVPYGEIIFDSWIQYITEDICYRECKAKFSTEGICYDGSNI